MAKKQVIDGTMYYPVKFRVGNNHCLECERVLTPNMQVYAKDNKDSGLHICRACMAKQVNNREHQLQTNVFSFSTEEILYIGKTGHDCSDKSIFSPVIAKFNHKANTFQLKIFKCECCNRYIMDGGTFQKNKVRLTEYKLVRSSTGKPITMKFDYSGNTLPYPPKKQSIEIPSTVRWATKHPFQGGKVSPK